MTTYDETETGRGGAIATALTFGVVLGILGLAVDPGWDGVHAEYGQIMARVGPLKGAIYALSHLVSVVALTLLILQGGALKRTLVWAGMIASATLELGMRALNGDGYELWEARLFFVEAGMADEAFRTFSADFARPAVLVVAGVLALEAFRWRCVGAFRGGFLRAGFALLLGLAGPTLVIAKTEGVSSVFPSFFKVPVVTALANLPDGVASPREAPRLAAPARAAVETSPRHVVFVVDESIRGDVLSLNGGFVPTPFLDAAPMVNYGVACAGSNSSAPSNILLQTGVGPAELLRNPAAAEERATIYQYARLTGRRTAFLAAQTVKKWYYVSPFDLAAIDHYRGVRETRPEIPDHVIDRELITELLGFLDESKDEGGFAYLLKMGAHFPYDEKHPGAAPPIDDTALAFEASEERRRRLKRYGRAVRWSADDFLRELLGALEGRDVAVVYTSDHGQSILEGGIRGTHGVYRDPPVSQANVPLLLMGANERLREDLRRRAAGQLAANRGRMTHFEIFPTLLDLMGFEAAAVRREFGPGLFDVVPARERRFFSGDPFQSTLRMLNDFD